MDKIRKKEFPLLDKLGRVYLDNGATTQEPRSVIEKMHKLRLGNLRGSNHSKNSQEAAGAQDMFDEAREKIQSFFGADNYFVAFTSGTTGASNTLATRFNFDPGDLLIITDMEHNSQVVTFKNISKDSGVDVKFAPVTLPDGRLDLEALEKVVAEKRSGKILLMLVHVSNVTGIINPVNKIRKIMGDRGLIYLDIAQSAGHLPINLDKLDVDFAGVSAHKMYGPMGMGAFFVKKESDKYLNNFIGGGSAVKLVGREETAYETSPARFEPGTQNIEGAIEWGFVIDFLKNIGMDKIAAHDISLGKYFLEELQKIPNIRILGPKSMDRDRLAVITFNIGSSNTNYEEVAKKLDARGISVRDGCFCAHLLIPKLLDVSEELINSRIANLHKGADLDSLNMEGAVRASFAFYNTIEDAKRAIEAIRDIENNL